MLKDTTINPWCKVKRLKNKKDKIIALCNPKSLDLGMLSFLQEQRGKMRLVPCVFILCEERKREICHGVKQIAYRKKKRGTEVDFFFKFSSPYSLWGRGDSILMRMKIPTLSKMRFHFLQPECCCLPRSSLMGNAGPKEASWRPRHPPLPWVRAPGCHTPRQTPTS